MLSNIAEELNELCENVFDKIKSVGDVSEIEVFKNPWMKQRGQKPS